MMALHGHLEGEEIAGHRCQVPFYCRLMHVANLITLMLLVAHLANTKRCKKHEMWLNPGIWVLIWEYSVRAIQWIPTWPGLDGFQESQHRCAFDESSLSIEALKIFFFPGSPIVSKATLSCCVSKPIHLWAPCRNLREPQGNSREPPAPSTPWFRALHWKG